MLLYGNQLGRQSKERIRIMRETTDGFAVAEKDLELRGPGEVLGTRQTGEMAFRIADLLRDEDLLPAVKAGAVNLVRDHPELTGPLIRRWLGGKEEYARV